MQSTVASHIHMFDTHCHLNFKAFKKNLDDIVSQARAAGITHIMVPGTDVKTSDRAVELVQQYDHTYAGVGIHPHHVFQYLDPNIQQQPGAPTIEADLAAIERLLAGEGVCAVGEVGLDKHVYEDTKYAAYSVDKRFLELQIQLFEKQVEFAVREGKSLILHNREAKQEMLPILRKKWHTSLEGHTVFHCCEPDAELLDFAREHRMFIGVDGDLTYGGMKQAFIKEVPLDMLVLETDAPFLLPEPLRSQKQYPNRPSNIRIIAETVAGLKGISVDEVAEATMANSMRLFRIG